MSSSFRVRARSFAALVTFGLASMAAGIAHAQQPGLHVAGYSLLEGNSGTKTAIVEVNLTGPSASPVTFSIATSNGTATAGSDYVARSLTAQTIAAGASSASFAVTVNGDTAVEANETFTVTVSAVTGATVTDGQATGTIVNDDVAAPPVLAARADRVVLRENAPAATISVLANDVITASRLSTGSLSLVSAPALGTATVQNNGTTTAADDTVRYTAPANRSISFSCPSESPAPRSSA